LLPDNTQAREIAEEALGDEKPEVRSSAASALGAMHSKVSIAKLMRYALTYLLLKHQQEFVEVLKKTLMKKESGSQVSCIFVQNLNAYEQFL